MYGTVTTWREQHGELSMQALTANWQHTGVQCSTAANVAILGAVHYNGASQKTLQLHANMETSASASHIRDVCCS